MTYDELLKEIDLLSVSDLDPDQLKALKTSLQIKISCINFYLRMDAAQKKICNLPKKCEE